MVEMLESDQINFVVPLKNGNRDAFNQLFNCYSQKLYCFARGYLKSEEEAEEIVQETFLKLWERKDYLNPELSVHAYLFKIAYNLIQKNLIRKFKDEALKHDLADELVDFDHKTSNALNYHFLLDHISLLIDKLPPRQKEIIVLRKLENYSTKDIAERLSISVKTVEAHLTAALKYLKEHLVTEKFDDLLLFALIFRKN
jgi:RNA polymerase sigma-70 factor (ECF subfamily)